CLAIAQQIPGRARAEYLQRRAVNPKVRMRTGHLRSPLEVQPERQLDLALRTQPDVLADGRVEHAERRTGDRRSVRLAGLNLVRRRSQSGRQRGGRIGEVRLVQNVVELCPEFQVALLVEDELLVRREIQLAQAGPVKSVAAQVAELSGRREGE